MKSLNKKIGAIALAVMVLAGGVIASGVSAHAESEEVKFQKELLSKVDDKQKSILQKIFKLGDAYNFIVVKVKPDDKYFDSLKNLYPKLKEFKREFNSYDDFRKEVINKSGNRLGNGFARVKVGDLDLIIGFSY